MTNLAKSKLLDILPPNLKSDPDIVAASKAIDKEYIELVNSISNVLTVADINNAKSEVVDHIAIESHADFYDFNLDIETRRKLAEKAIELHMKKGTPFAVEELVSILFHDGEVSEWFDYDGEPYTFRIAVNLIPEINERLRSFLNSLDSVKNKRSHLDKVLLKANENVGVKVEFNSYTCNYNMCGTFLCGTVPDYATKGVKLNYGISIATKNDIRVHKNLMSGEINSGMEVLK